jgi:diaminobutyrate-2-oxoglutarate transaminase
VTLIDRVVAITSNHGNDVEELDRFESSVRSYSRVYQGVFQRAQGACMFDQQGRRYIDFLCGAGALGYGHNNPRIKESVIAYMKADGVTSSLDLCTSAKLTFLRKFHEVVLQPRALDYKIQCCGPTGTDAVEAALKLARKVTGRHSVVAFTNAYHGVSLGSLAVTAGEHERAAAGIPLEFVLRAPFDGFLGGAIDTVEVIAAMFGPGGGMPRPAAFIIETTQAEGGVNVASTTWLRRLAELAARLGALLIVDDVQVGCGRTGTFFSFERAGIVPDIVCLSKSIGGMGMPMALALVRPQIDAWAPGEHVGTFRGNNLAFVAATAALEYWRDPDFPHGITLRANQMQQRLAALAQRHPGAEVRGLGMIQGLALPDPGLAKATITEAFEHGLILESSGARKNVLKLLPPLTISMDELADGLGILTDALDSVASRQAALAS